MDRTLRVLNVENSERDAALLARHLSRAGYELVSDRVETPEAMRAALESKEWDVILCDYSMPHFNALAALALLQETELDIPFIIISGTVGEAVAVEAMRAGAHDYLMKDNLARLAPTIEREMHEAENRRARRRAEDALRRSEAQYRRLLETTYEGVWMFDAEMRTAYVNQRLAEMLGVSAEEMIGRPALDFVSDDSHADLSERLQQRVQGVKEQYDLHLRRKDGSDLWAIVSATPILGERGEFEGSFSMLTDITERKRAEEERARLAAEVERQRQRLDNIVASVPGVVWEAWGEPDAATQQIDFVSEYVEQMLGYTVEEWLSTPNFWLQIVHPEDRERTAREAAENFASGDGIAQEFRWVAKDGRVVWVHARSVVTCDGEGRPRGLRGVNLDITERKRAEEALRESEGRYRLLFEGNPLPMWVYDLETLAFLEVNDAAINHYGYSREEFLSMTIADIRPPQEVPALLAHVRPRGEGLDEAGVWKHRKKGGEVIDVEVTSHGMLFAGQRAELVLANDVTERRRAEAALQESEERYRDLVENAHDIIYTHDLEGNYTSVNKAGERIMGYTREEVLGMNLAQTVAPESVETARRMIAEKLAGGKGTAYELEVVAKDGRRVPVEVNTRLIFQGGTAVGVQGIARDITERKSAEEALRFQKTLLESQSEASLDGILVVGTGGKIISYNARFTEMWGIPREVLRTHSDEEALRFVERSLVDPQEFLSTVEHLYRHPDEINHVEVALTDGRTFDRYSAPVKSADGEYYGRVWYFRDITEGKNLEEQLRQSQKLESIGMLAGGIAHDFNNLLTAIIGYSDLTLLRLREEDPLHRNVSEVKRAAERAASLTRQLLAFSRKQVLQPKVIDLNSTVSELEKMLRRLIGEDVELRTVLAPNLGSVKADPGQIEQVIMNLAVNARDAMPRGGKLIVETANVNLDDEYAKRHASVAPGAYVMLAVSDTGVGIDEQTRKRIFEPFFTTKETGKGTGLGLSTVYGIVKQSGGHIWVYSEVGRGTTFKVYLPRVDEGAQEYRRSAEVEEDLSGAETILLAEDEELVRTLARQVLEAYGYRVLEAANGGAALLICERHGETVDLLLTDVVMPEMSGRILAERLRQLRPAMKVLYMSGYTDNAIVHQGELDEGMNFIQKPFTPQALARKVREVLGREALK